MKGVIPTRRVMNEAQETNQKLGHETLGFLSEVRGFLPIENPRLALNPSHKIWDDVAAELPELFRTLDLRACLESMPVLDASPSALPEGDLYRAAAIFGIFAHSYHYVEPTPYSQLPQSVLKPWSQISERLHRPVPHLSFIDLNIYNWRLIDETLENPIHADNMQLLIPIVGNNDELRFQCTPIEIVAKFTPIVSAVIRAQEAVHREDVESLKQELILISNVLRTLTYSSFMKVNPNVYNARYVDPVVWGKTVAPLATPYQEDKTIPGPSGSAIPTFTLMDIFFGRVSYNTSVGHETDRTRPYFPPHWQAFLNAASEISTAEYVRKVNSPELTGLFQQAIEAYSGETGIIGRHRLKAYGFLDLSFKAGRSRTLGGFDGGFDDRLWDRMDDELELARQERYIRNPATSHFVRVKNIEKLTTGNTETTRVVLDIRGAGIRYQAGDRCAILPENDIELVNKTLRALQATGDEPIPLTTFWRTAMHLRDGYQDSLVLSLRTLLTFGRIRPVTRAVAKTLLSITNNETLHKIIEARAEDQWELWSIIDLLTSKGFNPKRFWKANPGEREHIARIVLPESFRTYSISSTMENDQADELHLTIGTLKYQTQKTDVSPASSQGGTGSSYLTRLATEADAGARRVSIKIIHPPRFSLPVDAKRPVVMFAGGTGIAPFRSMLLGRVNQKEAGENYLFFSTRTKSDLYYQNEWQELISKQKLHLQVAFTQEPIQMRQVGDTLELMDGKPQRIDDLLLEAETSKKIWDLINDGAYFYVCGRAGFAKTIMQSIQKIFAEHAGEAQAKELFYRFVGEDRYLQEVFTTYAGAQFEQHDLYDASEVVLHNNEQAGYWLIINGRVYDASEFVHIHPGGIKVIQSYAGMDASIAYKKVQHDLNPEVDSLLSMYQKGAVRRLNFGSVGGVAITPKGLQFVSLTELYETWIRSLYAVVEMENALLNDYSIGYEQVTYNEKRGEPQPSLYRTQLLLQTHERFLRDYLSKITGPLLDYVWVLTSGLCSTQQDYRWMKQQIASIESTSEAKRARALGADTLSRLKISSPDQLTHFENITNQFAIADKFCINKIKLQLRNGLQIFEAFEKQTLSQAQNQLLEIIQAMPQILTEYYAFFENKNSE